MTDRDLIERVAQLVGRKRPILSRPSTHKPMYGIVICGKNAINVMTDILPHMSERRSARITEILRLYPIARELAIQRRKEAMPPAFFAAIGRKGLAVRWGRASQEMKQSAISLAQ